MNPLPGPVILAGVVGSTAYGLAAPDSDIDTLGCYAALTCDVLGIDGVKVVNNSVASHNPDSTYHEIGKFVRLALGCNPTILELLYLDSYTQSTIEGARLVDIRSCFLSTARVRDAYGGYATQQAAKLLARHRDGVGGFAADLGSRTRKHGRHCWRLLLSGSELLATGVITVNVASRRDEIFAMGELAATNPEAFYTRFLVERERLDGIDSVIPDSPRTNVVNDWLIATRMGAL